MPEHVALEAETEYRFEVSAAQEFRVTLKNGSAEIFGVELAINIPYTFRDQKLAVFTWYGCALEVDGVADVAYTSDETPMNSYLNIHAQLQRRREQARARQAAGPRVLVAGPVDSGKSTLTQILLNYALRLGEKPTYVDLDVGQSSLGIPGAIAATPLDMNCITVEEEFILTNPLSFFYGHTNIADNAELYRHHLQKLAEIVHRRMVNDPEVNAAGFVINTSGWVDGLGYDMLVHAVQVFDVDVVLVIGQDRLFSRLSSAFTANKNVSIVKLTRSGGVVPLNGKHRSAKRNACIREYFYGPNSQVVPIPTLSPCVNEYSFDEIDFYAIKDMKVSDVMLPVGQTETDLDRLRVVKVNVSLDLLHSIAAVCHVKHPQDATTSLTNSEYSVLLSSPAAGFVCIKEIREEEKKLVLLVPSPGPLPSRHLLLGSMKWLE
ncbi:TPA: hypothetical protein N0F65_009125 [Lagenidium giganteum]|uniref:Protein CLP1 homolog n=1 Tax=Lagenidium giganteum TaxID=4803 RepID=A0AAV2YNV7_9STRA|nr:TPA: hypothetical protein N0F65_009125 [Lagenidium giganteum]